MDQYRPCRVSHSWHLPALDAEKQPSETGPRCAAGEKLSMLISAKIHQITHAINQNFNSDLCSLPGSTCGAERAGCIRRPHPIGELQPEFLATVSSSPARSRLSPAAASEWLVSYN